MRHVYHVDCFQEELKTRLERNHSQKKLIKANNLEILCFECQEKMNILDDEHNMKSDEESKLIISEENDGK